jgi:transcriptional regulator with XRE-family HTH domain
MQANFWGELIKKLREERGVTQRTLATEAGVNRSTLRRIEAGLTSGDMETVEKVLNFLGYELEALDRAYIEEHRKVASEMKRRFVEQAEMEAELNKKAFFLLTAKLTTKMA